MQSLTQLMAQGNSHLCLFHNHVFLIPIKQQVFLNIFSPQVPPLGVIAVAKMNAKHRFFLASTDNAFAGHRVDKVMIDNGYSSLLLPLSPGDLLAFPAKYPASSHVWRIAHSKGVSHSTVVLTIAMKTGQPMPVFLCSDLIPQQVPTTTEYLRFHLCTEDMKSILATPRLHNMFLPTAIQSLTNYMNSFATPISRKVHAVLGQQLFLDLAVIQLAGIIAIFKPADFQPHGWQEMGFLRTFINASASLPDNFNDLEDEAHVVDVTETDLEDYHALTTSEFIDESE